MVFFVSWYGMSSVVLCRAPMANEIEEVSGLRLTELSILDWLPLQLGRSIP